MVQVTREAVLAFVLVSCIAAGVAGTLENGLPRPPHIADEPTTAYGRFPELTDSTGAIVDCEWYGFANTLYPVSVGLQCLDDMRAALTNPTDNPQGSLHPYQYYSLRRMLDPANNEWECFEGCFNLGLGTAPASSPAYGPIYSSAPSPGPYFGPAMAPVLVDAPYHSPAYAPAPESGL